MEKYLLTENIKYRQLICKLRLNNSKIPKVTGRYKGIKERSKRLCTICSQGKMGDEYHLLFECSNAIVLQNRTNLPAYYINRPSMYKMLLLLQSEKTKIFNKLGAFLKMTLPLYK